MKSLRQTAIVGSTVLLSLGIYSNCDAAKVKIPDCVNPACKSKSEMLFAAMKKKSHKPIPPATIPPALTPTGIFKGCPVDKDELGRSTWNLIHTIAAHYPDEPSNDDKANAERFFRSLAMLYPCEYCAKDFQASIAITPPDVSSRTALCQWCCRLHNEVNEKLGKPTMSCDMESLDMRWKTGDPSCWEED
eukprot:gene6547-13243_t